MTRAHKLHVLAATLVVASAASVLPLLTSSSFTGTTASNGNPIAAVPDWTTPAVSPSVIGKVAGGSAAFIKSGGTYYVYATVSDTGAPSSGISTVKANVSGLTTGQTAVPLVAGSYTADGVSYGYRSAQLTAKTGLSSGAYSITATDGATNSTSANFSATVDNVAPSASQVQATNVSGGTAGKPELNDTLTLTYSEPIDKESILAGWTGGTANVQLVLLNGGSSSDYIVVYSATGSPVPVPVGTIYLNRTDVAPGSSGSYMVFGTTGAGTPTRMTASGSALTFALGTPSTAAGTASATGVMTWTPSDSATDRAGNAALETTRSESGTSDKDF